MASTSPSRPPPRATAPIRILLRSKDAVELYVLPDTSSSSSFAAATSSSPPMSSAKSEERRRGGGGGGGVGGGITLHDGPTTFHLLNPNGRVAYVHDAKVGLIECDLDVVENDDDDERRGRKKRRGRPFLEGEDGGKSVQLATCSPRGSYLLTWERPRSSSSAAAAAAAAAGGGGAVGDENDGGGGGGGGSGNLRAWDASSGRCMRRFHCKKATLNVLRWTHDEEFAFHLVNNELHVYRGDDLRTMVGRVRCASLSSFSLPTTRGVPPNVVNIVPSGGRGEEEGEMRPRRDGRGRYLLTVFVPGVKGRPARVDLLRYPDRLGRESTTAAASFGGKGGGGVDVPSGPSLASKSLYDAEEAYVQWSPRADSCLVQTQTTIDATGESYYGSSHLFLFAEDDIKRTGNGTASSVTLPNESTKTFGGNVPIVCSSWMPNPNVTGPVPFGVISGTMPSLSSLHHGITGEPTFLLGRAHRNTMDASPHGRFLVTGGYGNLAGGMDFWDRNKGKRIPRRIVLPPDDSRDSSMEENNAASSSYVTMREERDLVTTSPRPVVGHQASLRQFREDGRIHWAPDSRTYLVSTTSPRMNVDNGVSVYRYDGSPVEESILPWDNSRYRPDKLLCAEYVPAPFPSSTDVEEECGGDGGKRGREEYYYYPDRPQSPPPKGFVEVKGEAAEVALARLSAPRNDGRPGASGGGENGKGGVVPPAAAYVPPAARRAGGGGGGGGGGAYVPPGARRGTGSSASTVGGGGGGSLAERMRREREGGAANVSGVKIVKRTGPVGASSVVPAAAAASAAAAEKSKSAMRREKQILAKEKAEREAAEAERRKEEEERARVEANKADPDKRAKKINKMLKQIEDIKSKLVSGVELNDDQRKKMDGEEELRRELASLGL